MKKYFGFIIGLSLILLTACREDKLSDDPGMVPVLSTDTLRFDTVFSVEGSATMQARLYNPHGNALRIDRVWQDSTGEARSFYINVDGENRLSELSGIQLTGKDSLYIFVRVHVKPQDQNQPYILTDALHFLCNGSTITLRLEAYGQDVHLVRSASRRTVYQDSTFHNDRPYLIYDTLCVKGHTIFPAGTRLHFHDKALLEVDGKLDAKGTEAAPIVLMGDRIDRLFEHVPYSYSAGQWGGVIALKESELEAEHMHILSAENGLLADEAKAIQLTHCRIHNHSGLGIAVLGPSKVSLDHCEVSNTRSHLLYMAGGECSIDHSTFASYFGYTNVRIQNVEPLRNAAIFLDTIGGAGVHFRMANSITAGWNGAIQWGDTATVDGEYHHNYLDCDTVRLGKSHDNVYWQRGDTIFVNDYFRYRVYDYYNFHLSENSPARGIDEKGQNAGCYPE